jgi:hypothetical protein
MAIGIPSDRPEIETGEEEPWENGESSQDDQTSQGAGTDPTDSTGKPTKPRFKPIEDLELDMDELFGRNQ